MARRKSNAREHYFPMFFVLLPEEHWSIRQYALFQVKHKLINFRSLLPRGKFELRLIFVVPLFVSYFFSLFWIMGIRTPNSSLKIPLYVTTSHFKPPPQRFSKNRKFSIFLSSSFARRSNQCEQREIEKSEKLLTKVNFDLQRNDNLLQWLRYRNKLILTEV